MDAKNNYIGYYQLIDIISLFNGTPFFSEPGGIIVIEKGQNDFSFSEVSQIVESNNAKLLGAFISKNKNDLTQILYDPQPIFHVHGSSTYNHVGLCFLLLSKLLSVELFVLSYLPIFCTWC